MLLLMPMTNYIYPVFHLKLLISKENLDERKSCKTTPFYDSALKGDLSFGILPKQGGDRQMHS